MQNETRLFLDRLTDGALDTIAASRIEHGREPIDLSDQTKRAGGRYIAAGVIGHLLNLAQQAGADEDMQAVVSKIAAMFTEEAQR